MTKKVESNKAQALIPSQWKESMINSCKMMYLEWPGSVLIRIDGCMLHKLRKKKLKAISLKVKAKLISSMISDKPTKVLKTQRYLSGTKRKNKSLKYKPQRISYQPVQYSRTMKAAKQFSTLTKRHNSVMDCFTALIETLIFMKLNLKLRMKLKMLKSKLR